MLFPDGVGVGGFGGEARRMPSDIDLDDVFGDVQPVGVSLSFRDFPHVLGLDICDSDLAWFLELRRLRKGKLRRSVRLKERVFNG